MVCNNPIFQFISEFVKIISSIVLGILFIPLFPIIFLLTSPIYIFRFFISQISKWIRPDLGKILTNRSAFLSIFDVYTKPSLVLATFLVIKGNMEYKTSSEIYSKFEEKTSNGDYKYPEFRQYIHNWMGFPFWKWEKKFCRQNHITVLTPEHFTKAEAKAFKETLITKPFKKHQSPWEMIIVHNYIDDEFDEIPGPKCLAIFRIHHAFCDGYGILKIFLSAADAGLKELEQLQKSHEQSQKNISSHENIFYTAWKYIKLPYTLAYTSIDSFVYKPWGLNPSDYATEYICLTTPRISNDYVKTIKNGYHVGFTSVLITCLTSAIRKALQLKSIEICKDICTIAPFPVPGHPMKLRNHVTLGTLKLPVGESDSVQRLMKSHKSFLESRDSVFPKACFIMATLFGGVFHWMMKALIMPYFGSVIFSSLPGPQKVYNFGGYDALDANCFMSFPRSTMGIAFTIISYNGGFKFAVMADKAIFTKDSQVQEILDAILVELDTLSSSLV